MAAVGLVAAALAGADAEAALTCGKTITKDRKLNADLVNCPGDGLVVGAAGITIDLNGHRIDGTRAPGSQGIDVSAYTSIVVKGGGGGKVAQFEQGVRLLNGNASKVKGVTVKNTTNQAILVNSCDDARIRNNEVAGSESYSVEISHADDAEVIGNDVTVPVPDAVSTGGIVVNAGDTHNTVIEGNVVRGNDEATWGMFANGDAQGTEFRDNVVRRFTQWGLQVYDGSAETLVKGNEVVGNALDGIAVPASVGSGTTLKRNVVHDNGGDGIDVDGTAVSIGSNTAVDNDDWGIIAVPGVVDLGGNVASGNGAGQCSGVACGTP